MRRTCTSAMRASAAARVRSSRVRHGESAWASGQHTGTRHLVGPRSRVNVASRLTHVSLCHVPSGGDGAAALVS